DRAAQLDATEGGREVPSADAVVNPLAQLAAGDLLHLGGEIFIAVEDDLVGAVFLGEFGLVLRTDGADHVGAEIVRPLAGDEADAAGGGMDEHGVTLLPSIGTAEQILYRHAFEDHAGGLFVADLVRQLHRPVGR